MTSAFEDLSALGLSHHEIPVYIALLRHGECSVTQISTETGLHRQLVYFAVEQLDERGLVSVSGSKGKRRFAALSPTLLEDAALEKLGVARRISKELSRQFPGGGRTAPTRLFHGVQAIHRYYNASLQLQTSGSRVDILGVDSRRFFEIFPRDERPYERMEEIRVRRKIRWRILLGSRFDEPTLNLRRKFIELRVLPQPIMAPLDIIVWDDHVGMLVYQSEPMVIDIGGTAAALGFRDYIGLLWKMGQPVGCDNSSKSQ